VASLLGPLGRLIVASAAGGILFSAATGPPLAVAFLALAPAGLPEMALAATMLRLDATAVTAFQIARIALIASTVMPMFRLSGWITRSFAVLSAVRVVRAALPLLRARRDPAIVLLGAASARMPYPNLVVSSVHKAGLLALMPTRAGERAAEGIRVNSVAPGRTLTRLWTERADRLAAERGVTREAVIAEFAHEIPLGRFGDPEEVAAMVVWRASPRAGYITGQTVNVDGGIARGLL
jgi:NAD(P)-dependent dehydrogenase (short-subunit alcohol dehydrogenase family)